jgi:hypothetical protein
MDLKRISVVTAYQTALAPSALPVETAPHLPRKPSRPDLQADVEDAAVAGRYLKKREDER